MDVLVADADEETRLALVETIITIEPATRVTEAFDGRGLRAALESTVPDILFIDTILPGTNAADITAWRESEGARSVVVLVTDLLTARWPYIAKRIDAYDVILKPLGRTSVERVLKAAPLLRRGLNLLLAEPGARMRHLIRQVLERSAFDCTVVEAGDGAAAVRAARRQSFDLVLVGCDLPDIPALEVACRIDALLPDAKILMVGGAAEAMTAAQLTLFGARAFLRRPFGAADLDRTIYDAFDLWQPYLVKALRQVDVTNPALCRAG